MAMKGLHIDGTRKFTPGEPPPEGYIAWHEWADTQHKAGLRQAQCVHCRLWKFPQELASETPAVVCRKCAARDGATAAP